MIHLLVDSFDDNNIIKLLGEIEILAKNNGVKISIRFSPNTLSTILNNKDYLFKVRNFLDNNNVELDVIPFTLEDISNAITYGFTYHRDSMNDGMDVPMGNKLQWLEHYSKMGDEEKKKYIKSLVIKNRLLYTPGMVLSEGDKVLMYDGKVGIVKQNTPKLNTYKEVYISLEGMSCAEWLDKEKIQYLIEK